MKKKFENPIVGLSTNHKKKLACEIWYESVNNLKIVKKKSKNQMRV